MDIADRAEARRRTEHPLLRDQEVTAIEHGAETILAPERGILRSDDGTPQAFTGGKWLASTVVVDAEEVR
ncbi:hypothetical protein ACFQL1_16050 [Halomicroarcula sp. GCM10025709]|uniref:hypothetical protein n=1 Tax=Haloarcula TaxID=2237 RepID=UPI0024C26EA0|nr:hypothetical protein [Halomicroarcula sp. YJ-61-S]